MLKRIFLLMLALLFVLSFSACKKESAQPSGDTTAAGGTTTAAKASVTTAAKADVTTAPETTAAPSGKYAYIDFYEDSGAGHVPYSLLTEGSSIGMHFKVAEGFLEDFSINCPSWSNDIGSLTMRIYKWNTDYATTIAGKPAAEETFTDYVDNSWLFLYFSKDGAKGLEAGEYLVTLGDGVDASDTPNVGLWTYSPSTDPAIIEYFANGVVTTDYGWEASATVSIPG